MTEQSRRDLALELERLPLARWLKLGGGFLLADHLGVYGAQPVPFIEVPLGPGVPAQPLREDEGNVLVTSSDRPHPQFRLTWQFVFATLRARADEFDPQHAGWHRREGQCGWWFGERRVFVGMRGDWEGEFFDGEPGVFLAPLYSIDQRNGLLLVERGEQFDANVGQTRRFRSDWETGRCSTYVVTSRPPRA